MPTAEDVPQEARTFSRHIFLPRQVQTKHENMLYSLSPACAPRPALARVQLRTRPAPRGIRSAMRAPRATGDGEESETTVMEEAETMTGEELRALVVAKWCAETGKK